MIDDLRVEHRRFEDYMGNLPLAVFVVDAAGRPFYTNPAAHELLGLGVADVSPAELAEAYQVYVAGTDELYPTERMPVLQALQGVTTRVEDMEIARPDGRRRIEVWGSPVIDDDGDIAYALAAFVDITERTRAESSVHRQSALLRLLLESAAASNELEDVPEILRATLRAACQLNEWVGGRAWQTGQGAHKWVAHEIAPDAPKDLAESLNVALTVHPGRAPSDSPLERALVSGAASWTGDIESCTPSAWRDQLTEAGLKTSIACPILTGSSPAAVLELFSLEAIEPDPHFVAVMMSAAKQISHVIERLQRRDRHAAEREELAKLAMFDELTGLYNRRGFTRVAGQTLKLAARNKRSAAVLFVDLDNMKGINDTHGHHAGDAALRAVAGALTETLRDSDIVGRLGGDEFCVLLPEVDPGYENVVRDRIEEAIAAFDGGETIGTNLSVSIGIATSAPGSHVSIDRLMALADEDMYRRKPESRKRR